MLPILQKEQSDQHAHKWTVIDGLGDEGFDDVEDNHAVVEDRDDERDALMNRDRTRVDGRVRIGKCAHQCKHTDHTPKMRRIRALNAVELVDALGAFPQQLDHNDGGVGEKNERKQPERIDGVCHFFRPLWLAD